MTGMKRHSITCTMLAATLLLAGCGWFSGDNIDERAVRLLKKAKSRPPMGTWSHR